MSSLDLSQGPDGRGGMRWSSRDGSFTYRDRLRVNGLVRLVRLKRPQSGTFALRIVVGGDAVELQPPNPGTAACVALAIGGGDRYGVAFGVGSQISNRGPSRFTAKRPPAEAVCGTTTTSTTTPSTTSTSMPPQACTMPSMCAVAINSCESTTCPSSVCAATTEGGRICTNLSPALSCEVLTGCSSSADCGPGALCIMDTCCPSVHVCYPAAYSCGGSSAGAFVAPLGSGTGTPLF